MMLAVADELDVGSPVKGETYISTLMVDTFANPHFFKRLMPWLTRARQHGPASVHDSESDRLFSGYVATTRATHTLCLAMLVSSLGAGRKAEAVPSSACTHIEGFGPGTAVDALGVSLFHDIK